MPKTCPHERDLVLERIILKAEAADGRRSPSNPELSVGAQEAPLHGGSIGKKLKQALWMRNDTQLWRGAILRMLLEKRPQFRSHTFGISLSQWYESRRQIPPSPVGSWSTVLFSAAYQ